MKLIGSYQNGNYHVRLYSDGTKVRVNDLDYFAPEFPESIDLKITDYCDMCCPMCHENSTRVGMHGDILNLPFLDSLAPYTEIAIGGENPLSHPDLIPFLEKLKDRKLIANMTVNMNHFMKSQEPLLILMERGMIYGLGISYTPSYSLSGNQIEAFVSAVEKFPNAVIHIINGMLHHSELKRLSDVSRDLKILILGYKELRRGLDYIVEHPEGVLYKKKDLHDMLPEIIEQCWFDTVSFDNLAIKQLDVKRMMSNEEWNTFYMGDDGKFTMYIDAVSSRFAPSSVSRFRNKISDDIGAMFKIVRECPA